MDANQKVYAARPAALRAAVSVVALGVVMGGCSSVPDAVNPVQWYNKTTDFFSGDQTASNVQPAEGQNQGLSADSAAPPPATSEQRVAEAKGGLSADQGGRQYASEPIERQGAATDVLRPESEVAGTVPPLPRAQPTTPVNAAPVSPMSSPSAPQSMPEAMAQAAPPPAMPEEPRPGVLGTISQSALTSAPSPAMPMDSGQMPPNFDFASSMPDPFGPGEFDTVVISGDGMEAQPIHAQMAALPSDMSGVQASGAMFPTPGATTSGDSPQASIAGLTRVATIYFANSSSILDERDRSILGAVIQLQRERGGRVVVVGHASSRTRDMDYVEHQMANFQVSMERATTIGDELKVMGLSDAVIEVQAVSDTQPLFQEVMPSGEAGNRRVEIYLAAG